MIFWFRGKTDEKFFHTDAHRSKDFFQYTQWCWMSNINQLCWFCPKLDPDIGWKSSQCPQTPAERNLLCTLRALTSYCMLRLHFHWWASFSLFPSLNHCNLASDTPSVYYRSISWWTSFLTLITVTWPVIRLPYITVAYLGELVS